MTLIVAGRIKGRPFAIQASGRRKAFVCLNCMKEKADPGEFAHHLCGDKVAAEADSASSKEAKGKKGNSKSTKSTPDKVNDEKS